MKFARVVVLILCAGLVSVAWGQEPSCSGNWSEFHQPNMMRWNRCEKVLNVNNVGNLGLKWSYTTGGEVYSSPAVANGVVYVGSSHSPDNKNKLYALEASTGALLWSFTTDGSVYSSPAVADGVVYFASFPSNSWGHVYALHARTGALLWSFVPFGAVYSSPAVANPSRSNGAVLVGTSNGTVYALAPTTGGVEWSTAVSGTRLDSPAYANRVVYFRLSRNLFLGAELQHRCHPVEQLPRLHCGFFARRGEWDSLYRLA